jgi:hypothetical protein
LPKAFPEAAVAQAGFREYQHLVIDRLGYIQYPEVWDNWYILTGMPYLASLFAGLLKPKHKILGINIAGQVEAVGINVKRFQPGDGVFGHSVNHGGFAEYVCGPEC